MTLRMVAGRELLVQPARDRARADRLAGGDIGVDDLAEDLPRSGVELDDHPGAGPIRCMLAGM